MGFWSSLFGNKRPKGLYLTGENPWEVGPLDFDYYQAFFAALAVFLPDNAILYFEGTSICREARQFFMSTKIEPEVQIAMDAIWFKPETYHIPATQRNLLIIADLFEEHAAPEICDHFHAYADGKVLLAWHDAFHKYPFFMDENIAEDKIASFCESIKCKFRKFEQ